MSGSISFEEFSAATAPLSKTTLRAAFDLFDTDNTGAIERTEFASMLQRLGLSPPPVSIGVSNAVGEVQIDELFAAADRDGNGSVSFEEFVSLLPAAAAHSRSVQMMRTSGSQVQQGQGVGRRGTAQHCPQTALGQTLRLVSHPGITVD